MEVKSIALIILALLVGGVLGFILKPTQIQECPEVKCPEVNCPTCPDCSVEAPSCPECPECPDVTCPICEEDEEEVKDKDLKAEVSEEYGVPAYILKNSRTCNNWLDEEKAAGNVDDEVEGTPFCWKKDGKFERTIARMYPQDDGCKFVYIMGC